MDSTKRTAELFDKPQEGGAVSGETAWFQRDGSMTQEEEMGRKQIQRVVSGQEDSGTAVTLLLPYDVSAISRYIQHA